MPPQREPSYSLPDDEPLSPANAKHLICWVMQGGQVTFSKHALKEMEKDGLESTDVVNVLRAGRVAPGELERGTWRYQVCTPRMVVVVSFRSTTELRVVTAWRRTS